MAHISKSVARKSATGRCAFVIFNPVSGHSDRSAMQEECAQVLAAHGWKVSIAETDPADWKSDRLVRSVQDALREGCDLVVAGGGDGTVSIVADALTHAQADGEGVPLGILPMGTSNILARELGIPSNVVEAAALFGAEHECVWLDAMRVESRLFVCQIGLGLDAAMIEETTRAARGRFGWLAYAAALVKRARAHRPIWVSLDVDGRRVQARAIQVVIANAATLAAPPLRWGPGIHPADGKVCLCLFLAATPYTYLRTAWNRLLRRPSQGRSALFIDVYETVTLRTKRPMPAHGDGEMIGKTPFTVRVVKRAVPVIVPTKTAEKLREALPATGEGAVGRESGGAPPSVEVASAPQRRRVPWLARLGSLDASLFLRINASNRSPLLDRVMWAASRGVYRGEVWILAALLGMIIDPPARRRVLLDVVIALALATLTVNYGLKRVARRPRPFLSHVEAVVSGRRPSDSSFPSGHTAAAFAGAWLLSAHYPALSPLFYAYAALVGWSRIYLGVHYPSDVMIGAGCGVGLALLFHTIVATLMDVIL